MNTVGQERFLERAKLCHEWRKLNTRKMKLVAALMGLAEEIREIDRALMKLDEDRPPAAVLEQLIAKSA